MACSVPVEQRRLHPPTTYTESILCLALSLLSSWCIPAQRAQVLQVSREEPSKINSLGLDVELVKLATISGAGHWH